VRRRELLGAAIVVLGLALNAGARARTPPEASDAASAEAKKRAVDAGADAASAKRDADYIAARKKCDAFKGEVKASCVGNTKARFGKDLYERERPTIWNGVPNGMSLSRRSNSFFTTA